MYDDVKDQASIKGLNDSFIDTIDTKYLTWNRENFNESNEEVQVTVRGSNESLIGIDGAINLKVNFGSNFWLKNQIFRYYYSVCLIAELFWY